MERRRGLADLLAVAASELLAHMLDDLPLPRNDFQRLGHVLAELVEARSAAACACHRPRKNDALARQMRWKGLAGRLSSREGADCGRLRRIDLLFGGEIVRRGVGLELLEFELHLLEQPRLALAAHAIELASKLLDRELQMRDQSGRIRSRRARLRQLRISVAEHRLQSLDIVGKRISGAHGHDRITKARAGKTCRCSSLKKSQPAASGRHVYCGARQSMPERR